MHAFAFAPPVTVNHERTLPNASTQRRGGHEEQSHSKASLYNSTPLHISLLKYLQVSKLLHGVGRVGDELPQEDLLVRVDRVRHDVQQLPRLRLELQFLRIP